MIEHINNIYGRAVARAKAETVCGNRSVRHT